MPSSDPYPVVDTGHGRPLVLLHGWTCHGGHFAATVAALGDRFRTVVPDLRGHRHAHRPGERPTIADLGADLSALLETRDLDSAVLVGWSMGAMAAFTHLAAAGPAGLGGLVVVDMAPRIVNDGEWNLGVKRGLTAEQSDGIVALMQQDWPAYARAIVPGFFAADADPALIERTTPDVVANDPTAMASLWASMADQDFRDLLPRLDLPALMLTGGASQVYAPETGDYVTARLPRATRVVLEGVGHSPPLEAPGRFAEALADFADSLPPACIV